MNYVISEDGNQKEDINVTQHTDAEPSSCNDNSNNSPLAEQHEEQQRYPISCTLLPEELFCLRQSVPPKSSLPVAYVAASSVYVLAILAFVYIFYLELHSSSTETTMSSYDLSLDSDSEWTCSMSSIVSTSTSYDTVEISSDSLIDNSYDLINVNDFQEACFGLLTELNPCSMENITVTLNNTNIYSIGGWMSYAASYSLNNEDFVYLGVTNNRVSPSTYLPYQIKQYNRRTGDMTLLWGSASSDFTISDFCYVTYFISFVVIPSPQPISQDSISLFMAYSGWLYWLPTHSDSVKFSNNQIIKCQIVGLSSSSYVIAQITSDNLYESYALAYSPPVLTKSIRHFTFHIMQLKFVNQTVINYKPLFNVNTSTIQSIAVYKNVTNNETLVFYATCHGVYRWSTFDKLRLIVSIPSTYSSSSDGTNNYKWINVQYDPFNHLLYLTNLNYPAVIDPNSNAPQFASLASKITPHQPCYAYGAAVAISLNHPLLFSCDSFSSGALSNVYSLDQIIYIALIPGTSPSQYSYTVVDAGYNSSLVGWYICDNDLQTFLPNGLTMEQTNCSANGLAWRSTYIGEDKYFIAADAAKYFTAIAKHQCTSGLYSLILESVSNAPPYLCNREIMTSTVSALSTAVANTQLWVTLTLMLIGMIFSKLQIRKKKALDTQEITRWKLWSPSFPLIEQNLLPPQFFHLPFDPVVKHQLSILYVLSLLVSLVCAVVFVTLIISQWHQTLNESKLSTSNVSTDGWKCSMSTYLTKTAFATVENLDPQQSYSFINVNELYDECVSNLHASDPCANGTIYDPISPTPVNSQFVSFQSAYPQHVLFTASHSNDFQSYYYFSKLNFSSGIMSNFACALVTIYYNTVAQGPDNVGYYPPQSSQYQTIFNQDCQAVSIVNVPTNWLAQSIVNDQLYNLYAISGTSIYQLVPATFDDANVTITSFKASVCLTVSTWQEGLVAVFFNTESSLPVIYYVKVSGSSTYVVKYYHGATHQVKFPTSINMNMALNPNGTILYVMDSHYILHCIDASSSLLTTLTKSNLKTMTPNWIASFGPTSILVKGNGLMLFNVVTNVSIPFEYTSSGTRIGWFVCGNESLATLPTSLSGGASNCSGNGIWWQLAYESDYYKLANAMELAVAKDYSSLCTNSLYEQICVDIGNSPPYICNRLTYLSLADASSTALANTQILFTILCFASGVIVLFCKQFSQRDTNPLNKYVGFVFKSNAYLPNAFFNIKQYRQAKASPRILVTVWLLVVMLVVSLFVVLIINQYQNTSNIVNVELQDISNDDYSCSMASIVSREYAVDLTSPSSTANNDYASINDATQGIFFLININESYDECMSNINIADPCGISYDAEPINWQLTKTDAVARTDLFAYSSSYSNVSNALYFSNGNTIAYKYRMSDGILDMSMNCPLASYLSSSGLLTGEYVAINEMDIAYFLGISGIVTYDCEEVTILNGSKPLFADTIQRTASNTYVPGIPHILTNDNRYQVYTCVNSTHSHWIECYSLHFVNKTYATTSYADMIWSSNTPLAQFATCSKTNSSGANLQYIAYSLTTVAGLYLFEMVNGHRVGPISLVLFKTISDAQFDGECEFLYFSFTGTGIQRVNITGFFLSASTTRYSVVSTTATTYFCLASPGLLMYSTLANSDDFMNIFNISSSVSSIIYTGFQYSVVGWFVCMNQTLQNIPYAIPSPIQGVAYCPANGLVAQWKFDNNYYFTQEMMSSYMIQTSQNYCQNQSKVELYDKICSKVANLPPYICSTQVRQSWLKILSVGIANSSVMYVLLLSLFGFAFSAVGYYATKSTNTSTPTAVSDIELTNLKTSVVNNDTMMVVNPVCNQDCVVVDKE